MLSLVRCRNTRSAARFGRYRPFNIWTDSLPTETGKAAKRPILTLGAAVSFGLSVPGDLMAGAAVSFGLSVPGDLMAGAAVSFGLSVPGDLMAGAAVPVPFLRAAKTPRSAGRFDRYRPFAVWTGNLST